MKILASFLCFLLLTCMTRAETWTLPHIQNGWGYETIVTIKNTSPGTPTAAVQEQGDRKDVTTVFSFKPFEKKVILLSVKNGVAYITGSKLLVAAFLRGRGCVVPLPVLKDIQEPESAPEEPCFAIGCTPPAASPAQPTPPPSPGGGVGIGGIGGI